MPAKKMLSKLKLRINKKLSSFKNSLRRIKKRIAKLLRLKISRSKTIGIIVLGTLAIGAAFIGNHLPINDTPINNSRDMTLRAYIGAHTYRLLSPRMDSAGTGFSVEAPSGKVYILTNYHVCEGLMDEKREILVYPPQQMSNKRPMVRRVIEISDETDICLIENLPYQEGGLKLSEEILKPGDRIATFGHPLAWDYGVFVEGEIIGPQLIKIAMSEIKNEQQAKECSGPKKKIENILSIFFVGKVCYWFIDAYRTTVTIFPGNSGSPVVNNSGNVVGMMFASDETNWGAMIPNNQLREFLKNY